MTRKVPVQDRPGVGIGVVVWRDDYVLLIKRKHPPMEGQWALPGGKQELGETIFEGAVREVREETGLDITPLGIITALDAISRDKDGRVIYHYTLVEVAAEAGEGEPVAADDADDVRWATLDDVATLCEWPEIQRIVRMSALMKAI